MKRSEMIKYLSDWLNRSKTTVLMNGNEGKAKSLLDQLEKWGMNPPIRKDINNLLLDNGIMTGICFEWDDEDNEKK